ncbi:MAG: glycerophosphodiester phosphodiesterase [Bacteroidota bacterium]
MRFSRIIIAFFIFSCSKEKNFDAVQVFGHAGNGIQISNSVYHDNSQEAVDLALAQNGCAGVEVDIQLSKDGTAWLFHDPDMERETGETGCIPSKTDAKLGKITYSSFHSENLLRLKELDVYGKSVFLDLKHVNSCAGETVILADLMDDILAFRDNNPSIELRIITFNPEWIDALLLSGLEIFYEAEHYEEASLYFQEGLQGFVFKNENITKDQLADLKNKGFRTVLFEARSPKGIRRALRKYPDYILADDIKATLIEKY